MLLIIRCTKVILRMLSGESVTGMNRKDTEVEQKAICMELFVNETFCFVVVVVLLVMFAVFTR